MLIDAAEMERRLRSGKNLLNQLGLASPVKVLDPPKRTNTPALQSSELRVLAGTAAHMMTAGEVAASLNITEQQVRSAKHSEDASIRSRVERSVEEVQELALRRTLESLELLTPDVVGMEKPRDVAAIAANMSKIYANTRNVEKASQNNAVQFIVYAPNVKSERHFDVIEAGVA